MLRFGYEWKLKIRISSLECVVVEINFSAVSFNVNNNDNNTTALILYTINAVKTELNNNVVK